MNKIVHHLNTDIQPPHQFTFPFCYEPHPLCRLAAAEVEHHIVESGVWQGETSCGKMFGVLVVRYELGVRNYELGVRSCELGFIAAYSGLLAGRNDWAYFVPPVFDAQQPDGHFKVTERSISDINREIDCIRHSDEYKRVKAEEAALRQKAADRIAAMKQHIASAKAERDRRRSDAQAGLVHISEAETAAMTRESQTLKADLRRLKQRLDMELSAAHALTFQYDERIAALRQRRRSMSDELQRWLFMQYRMLNARGEERNLIDIFSTTTHGIPPAGAGDCCAPKLLQYAYSHGLQPVCMAEFWWGESPRQEIRHHLSYYPACRSKCLPILTHMLQGLDVEPNPLTATASEELKIVYEDDAICVVDKPAGMLSVPGKDNVESVESIMRQRWHQYDGNPIMVHRLDRDTSGLMVVARTLEAYHSLQQQFACRTAAKRYEAVLDGVPALQQGTISLPLMPDITDRPRQRVDMEHGKPSVTTYRVVSTQNHRTLVWLFPHTGRTHQLRVHCAHPLGLATPILGDPLYGRGTAAPRMYLNAAELEITHPVTGRRMQWKSESAFPFY
ncbi:MAG: pseudouridine synthase [Prevotella sp.]|uniref:RluA family pseudouridine synthase n=2 Tax=Prevotellaceae TaxID=171552 RepID=UPI001F2C03FC|nr:MULTISPECIES: RluA family pseudouridine synthase [Prevotellaceae]MCF2577824.1 RNA pseudouridine synthase [Leyella stercorea]MCI7184120.1 pseudouridine synthase [Prevotella sp.]